MPRRKQPTVPDELLDQLLGGSDPQAALAEGGLLDDMKKAPTESAVLTGTGKLELQIPRDRLASFDPQLVAKYQRRLPGFDAKIIYHVRPRHKHPGDPGAPARALWLEVSPDWSPR